MWTSAIIILALINLWTAYLSLVLAAGFPPSNRLMAAITPQETWYYVIPISVTLATHIFIVFPDSSLVSPEISIPYWQSRGYPGILFFTVGLSALIFDFWVFFGLARLMTRSWHTRFSQKLDDDLIHVFSSSLYTANFLSGACISALTDENRLIGFCSMLGIGFIVVYGFSMETLLKDRSGRKPI